MEFWQSVAFSEPEQLTGIARHAEEVGFDGLLVSDHLAFPEKLSSKYPYSPDGSPGFDGESPFPEPFAAICAMAAVTTRLRFATLIYVLPLRHPLEVAKASATAAVLSGGRFALGCGAGWIREEYDALGVDFASRGRRYDESIEVLRKLWSGEMVEHHGEHFDFDRLQVCPAPAAPAPIWIGGIAAPALRRAARLGDGWLGTGQTPDEAAHLLDELARLRAEAGRSAAPFSAIVPLTVPPSPDVLHGLEARGATGTVAFPFLYALGRRSSLDAKRAVLDRYAAEVIGPASS